jgi:hypothetical protein
MTRVTAAAAGLSVLAGAVVMFAALVAAPGPWYRGYVSEAGVAGQPYAHPYRWGLILLAGGVAGLGIALHRRQVRLAPVMLVGSGALAATSSAVPCTERCPLPPLESSTVADVVHMAAAVAGMAVLAGAIVAVACSALSAVVRRLAAVAATVIVPLGAAMALTMLIIGRGWLGAALERVLLVIAVSWLVGTAGLIAVAGSRNVDALGDDRSAGRGHPRRSRRRVRGSG